MKYQKMIEWTQNVISYTNYYPIAYCFFPCIYDGKILILVQMICVNYFEAQITVISHLTEYNLPYKLLPNCVFPLALEYIMTQKFILAQMYSVKTLWNSNYCY